MVVDYSTRHHDIYRGALVGFLPQTCSFVKTTYLRYIRVRTCSYVYDTDMTVLLLIVGIQYASNW